MREITRSRLKIMPISSDKCRFYVRRSSDRKHFFFHPNLTVHLQSPPPPHFIEGLMHSIIQEIKCSFRSDRTTLK